MLSITRTAGVASLLLLGSPGLPADASPNTRSLSEDPERATRLLASQVKVMQEAGLISTVKHFPGDGVDFRDQHLVTTVNSLSLPEWRRTCGRVFQGLIEAGVASVMVGHLTLPAYQKERLEGRLLPATLPARSSPICSRASWASRGW